MTYRLRDVHYQRWYEHDGDNDDCDWQEPEIIGAEIKRQYKLNESRMASSYIECFGDLVSHIVGISPLTELGPLASTSCSVAWQAA